MNRPKPPKKTETLEVRLPHAVKQALMARTRAQGRTASAVLRELVDSYLAEPSPRVGASPSVARPIIKRYFKPVAASTVVASALALYALTPSAVAAAPDLRTVFETFDRDDDGAIGLTEFLNGRKIGSVIVPNTCGPGPSAERATTPPRPEAPDPLVGINEPEMVFRAFVERDRDCSGSVTFDEFEAHHRAMYRQRFATMDLDRDGAIEAPEYGAAARRAPGWPSPGVEPFESADENGDGRINWQEFFG